MSTASPTPVLAPIQPEEAVPQQLTTLLASVRRHLHANPEIGMQEHATARFVREVLEMHGLEVQGPIAETGLYVDVHGAGPGPSVGYRADIDALPSPDLKTTPYASRCEGVGHLCGHDAHTAVAIGVALLAHHARDRFDGTLRVFFQPNEEGIPSGAPLMIDEGILDGLEAVYAIHVDPTLDVGRYGLIAGPFTAAADRFSVFVRGRSSGHSARPHQSVDTVWVATQLAQHYYQLAGRITDARNAAVLTICRFRGGDAFNVIPAEVEFGGTLRCTQPADRATLQHHLQVAADQFGALHGCEVELRFDKGAPPVVNDRRLIDNLRASIVESDGPDAVFDIPCPSMGGEDFAHYLTHVPGAMVRVGTASSPATRHPLHDQRFDLDEAALVPAARTMTQALIRHLNGAILG